MFPIRELSWNLEMGDTVPEKPGCSSHVPFKLVFNWYLNIHFTDPVPLGLDEINTGGRPTRASFGSRCKVPTKSTLVSVVL